MFLVLCGEHVPLQERLHAICKKVFALLLTVVGAADQSTAAVSEQSVLVCNLYMY